MSKETKDLEYWKNNCKEDYIKTPISVLRYISELEKAITVTHCCKKLKDEGQATLTEYAKELINMQQNPQDSNKDWKIVVIKNTIGKLYETLQNL